MGLVYKGVGYYKGYHTKEKVHLKTAEITNLRKKFVEVKVFGFWRCLAGFCGNFFFSVFLVFVFLDAIVFGVLGFAIL